MILDIHFFNCLNIIYGVAEKYPICILIQPTAEKVQSVPQNY